MSVPEFYDHHEHMPPGVDPERQAGEFNEGPTHALALFLNQLPKGTPSDEQQRTWARAIKAGRVAEQQLRQAVEDGSSLNTDSLAATQEIIEQGHKAKKEDLLGNATLAVSRANRFMRRDSMMSLGDLVNTGMIALNHVIEKNFDPEKEYRFSTIAIPVLDRELGNAVDTQSWTIQYPVRIPKAIRKLHETEARLAQKLGRMPLDIEIDEDETLREELEKLQMTPGLETVRDLYIRDRTIWSLDESVAGISEGGQEEHGTGQGLTLESPLSDKQSTLEFEHAEWRVMSVEICKTINDIIDSAEKNPTVAALMKQVLEWRYGLRDGIERTHQEIAEMIGKSAARSSQLEQKALRILRDSREFEDYRDAA